MSVKFGWDTEKQEENGLSLLVGTAIIFGTVGYAFGGKLMQIGRRIILLWGLLITSFGNSMMGSGTFPIHLTGASIYAFGQGLMKPATYRLLEEYVP